MTLRLLHFFCVAFLLVLVACKRDVSAQSPKTEVIDGTVSHVMWTGDDAQGINLVFFLEGKTNSVFLIKYANNLNELIEKCALPAGSSIPDDLDKSLAKKFSGQSVHFKCVKDQSQGTTDVYSVIGMADQGTK
jgi:hypothetical protein